MNFGANFAQFAEGVSQETGGLPVFGVLGFGLGLVFIGLISIIVICSIMGLLCRCLIKDKKSAKTDNVQIPNKGEFIAAVSAALAEDMGKDISGLRILSVKKL